MFLSDANMVETNGTGRIKIVASINVAGKVTTPSLCCTTLTLESTVERRQTYKLLLYYVCRPEWGTVSQDMALTEQKSDMVVIYEPAKPTRILLVELTVRWDTANNFVKKDRKVWKIDGGLIHAGFDARNLPLEIGCGGVRMLQTLNISATRCGSFA